MTASTSRTRLLAYWAVTLLIAFELVLGGSWDLARTHYVRALMDHLGYPLYTLTILGCWKIAGACAIVTPRFTRLKEWAYAGMFFNFTGAAASHLFAGDGPRGWAAPAFSALLTLASWALRPPSRVLGTSALTPTHFVQSASAHASSL